MRNSRDETLPGWCYNSAEFFALEREHLLMSSWVLAGHRNDLKQPGDFISADAFGERALVVLGEDGRLRGFFNTFRHRAHALVAEERGSCGHAIRCPYHGWTYSFDGKLKAIAAEKTFPHIDKSEFGLRPLEGEVRELTDILINALGELKEANAYPDGIEGMELAVYARDKQLAAMAKVREAADNLEKVVADDLWPLPKYEEMLFIK